jgi:hypothetical protein
MKRSLILWVISLLVCPVAAAQRTGPPFPRIANCYAVGLRPDSKPSDIEEIARFDLLIGGVWCNWSDADQRRKLAENIAAVRKRNPTIAILDFSSSAPYAYPKDAGFPKSGWLLQPDGSHILGWPGTEMINLTRPEVIEWLAGRSLASVRDKGFDGTFIDCMGGGFDWWACNIEHGAPYQIDADGDGKPDDRAWLNDAWLKAKTDLARKVREGIGPKPVFMTNGAGAWGLPYMNGILLEDRLDYVLEGRGIWEDVVQEYLRWTEAPNKPNVTTIVSSSGLEPPYEAWKRMDTEERKALLERGHNLKDRMRFGLATTLMGDGYYAYDLHTRFRGQRWWYPEYDAPLGYPKGKAQRQADGTWRREFDGGTVIVNPTLFDVEARFVERRKDLSSEKVGQEFIVPLLDGRILIPTDAPVASGSLADPSPLPTLTSPVGIAERGEFVLCHMNRAVAAFDHRGQMGRLTADGVNPLIKQLTATIVKTPWRDFGYADCRRQALADGGIRFTGRRTGEGVTVAYEEGVAVENGALRVKCQWEASSDAHFHMFRYGMDFPVAQYGGGRFRIGEAETVLPQGRALQPRVAGPFRQITMIPTIGPRISVELSKDGMLVDERHFGADVFRLGCSPVRGDVKAGAKWDCSFRIRIE